MSNVYNIIVTHVLYGSVRVQQLTTVGKIWKGIRDMGFYVHNIGNGVQYYVEIDTVCSLIIILPGF